MIIGAFSAQSKSKMTVCQEIEFDNGPCIGENRNGTCFTAAECAINGFIPDGLCAGGYGVCCIAIIGKWYHWVILFAISPLHHFNDIQMENS